MLFWTIIFFFSFQVQFSSKFDSSRDLFLQTENFRLVQIMVCLLIFVGLVPQKGLS